MVCSLKAKKQNIYQVLNSQKMPLSLPKGCAMGCKLWIFGNKIERYHHRILRYLSSWPFFYNASWYICPFYVMPPQAWHSLSSYTVWTISVALTHWGREKMVVILWDNIYKFNVVYKTFYFMQISLKFVSSGPSYKEPARAHIMASRRTDDKPLG